MSRRFTIEEQVEKTINSLDGIERAKSNPFMYTRIQARLQDTDNSQWGAAARILNRPVFALATLVFVILINALFFLQSNEPAQVNTMQDEDQMFAREYTVSQGMEDWMLVVNNDELP
jgi:hypothetical protein